MSVVRSSQGRKQLLALVVAAVLGLAVWGVPQAAPGEVCFNQPGVTDCVAAEFATFWKSNGGLEVFGYPLGKAKQEQTPDGTFLVQYFERQRLELHPDKKAPYTVLLGRANAEVLEREGRDWRTFPEVSTAIGTCVAFSETKHTVCDEFLRQWRSAGLNLGDRGVSYREALALWGLPLSQPQQEQNIDGDTVLTQHFERARMELHTKNNKREILLTRLGAALVPLEMKILAVNDFHGQLSTGRQVAGKNAGGAAYLAAYLNERRTRVPYSLTVHAGDMIGASAPVSALFQDQPTMEFLNAIKFDVGTAGNHEFDEGLSEFKRLLEGGCHPTAGCWEGTKFPYVTSNVFDTKTGKPVFNPYTIVRGPGIRIGFVGAVLKGTPEIVVPAGIAGLEFRDEVESINAAVADLRKQGVRAIVVLIHQGGNQATATSPLSGPITGIANAVDDEVDLIVSGHTHQFTNAVVDGKLITQAFSYSTAFADIDLTIDRAKRDIVAKKAEIVTTFNDGVTPDPKIATLVKQYEDKVAPLINQVIGTAAGPITADQNPAGESPLGNLIADAQRAKLQTQMAFMNPGGIRAPINAGPVTFGTLYAVQPFANDLVKMSLTGDQIYKLLNQQWQPQADGSVRTRFLQISGLAYTWNDSRAIGDKVVEVRGPNNQPISREAVFTVTVNNFLAGGGDAFTILRDGTNRSTGGVDLDALVDYIKAIPQPFNATIEGRIMKQ